MTCARFALLPILACSLAACQSEAERQADATEDRIEQEADASAAAAGTAIAVFGMTESELLDADLVAADGTDLGDIEQVRRGPDGTLVALLVELDGDPDRYVIVPLDGLSPRVDGADTDVQTAMAAADLRALPAAQLDATATGATPGAATAPAGQ